MLPQNNLISGLNLKKWSKEYRYKMKAPSDTGGGLSHIIYFYFLLKD
jgi:hypothetical protein